MRMSIDIRIFQEYFQQNGPGFPGPFCSSFDCQGALPLPDIVHGVDGIYLSAVSFQELQVFGYLARNDLERLFLFLVGVRVSLILIAVYGLLRGFA